MARPQPTDGARMVYLIKRKTETTREELIAHWFANHMPGVIAELLQAYMHDHGELPVANTDIDPRMLGSENGD